MDFLNYFAKQTIDIMSEKKPLQVLWDGGEEGKPRFFQTLQSHSGIGSNLLQHFLILLIQTNQNNNIKKSKNNDNDESKKQDYGLPVE